VQYQDSRSAKSYQAPSNNIAEATPTPAPAASPTKKKKESAGSGGLDAILGANGIKLQSNGKRITVGGDGVSFSKDSNSAEESASETTPESKKQSPQAPEWLPVPEGAKGVTYTSTGIHRQVVFTVDQPASEVVDFYQQQLSEQGLHIQSVNSGVAYVLVVTSSSKNAKINISAPSESQTIVQIAYEE
jgi:hypothetical protein